MPHPDTEKLLTEIKKDYVVISKPRVRHVYAFIGIALCLGIGIGIGYVMSGGGNFSSTSAAVWINPETREFEVTPWSISNDEDDNSVLVDPSAIDVPVPQCDDETITEQIANKVPFRGTGVRPKFARDKAMAQCSAWLSTVDGSSLPDADAKCREVCEEKPSCSGKVLIPWRIAGSMCYDIPGWPKPLPGSATWESLVNGFKAFEASCDCFAKGVEQGSTLSD